jgi:hypothetical protein
MKINRRLSLKVVPSCFGLLMVFVLMLPIQSAQGAYLFRSNFSTGMDGWDVGQWGGEATWTTDDHQLCVTVTNPGVYPWEVSIYRPAITLLHAHTYTVSYDISASQPASVQARLQHDGDPYTQYYAKAPLTISEVQTVTESFTNDYADDGNVMFVFQVGGGLDNVITPGTTICVDNISLADPAGKPVRNQQYHTVLFSGEWKKITLGPSSAQGGYVVDITPLANSTDGTHVEKKVLPEFDGEQWNDVLWMLMPEQTHPLAVKVDVYSTAGWPVVWQSEIELAPGEASGYCVRETTERGASVIEINPHPQEAFQGDTFLQALINLEFPWGAWLEVLRIQVPLEQSPMQAEVVIYSQPDLPVVAEFELVVEPGVWQGYLLGPSSAESAYLVEIDPLVNEGTWLDIYTIQPEFDGKTWNDVLRLHEVEGYPPMPLIARVYAVEP